MDDENSAVYDGLDKVARAITADASPGNDAAGGSISSLTEAVMGMTAGLYRIAEAIETLAEAVENRPQ